MNRIQKMFKHLKAKKEKALFPFIVAGYPDTLTTEKVLLTLAESGADLIEIGVPFSDPVADGPIIQEASYKALVKGINLDCIFNIVKKARKKIDVPIVLMSYYNPILAYGLSNAVKMAKKSGVDGFIIPDLLPEDADEFNKLLKEDNLAQIFLVTINSSEERIKKICRKSTGFIYLVSRFGVTGPSRSFSVSGSRSGSRAFSVSGSKNLSMRRAAEQPSLALNPIKDKIKLIKKYTKTPIAVGFGISNPKQAKQIAKIGDAVIVGSAIVKIMNKQTKQIASFIKSFKQ
ncbi:tryptophan synthase subunit alpha [bacterium]